MVKTRDEKIDEFTSYLGEGFHTAFRKAADSAASSEIHQMIRKLDNDEWEGILRFVAEPLYEFAEDLIVGKQPTNEDLDAEVKRAIEAANYGLGLDIPTTPLHIGAIRANLHSGDYKLVKKGD